ncbi:hypothetical protein P2P98_07185 [Microbacterium sp. Kw_RZR3]|uniref:hypothetical protein n=1 Tax=Microbacterium sp. Kw_RZR3 TaxID=3032903 RepID=UPI0023DBF102|nr:hypothetical protein [Microbacterium sp. Kw_RZR3]MDF2045938.1 hypothetical protein [Microbacterium sp. Kw_RZR3]
MYEPDSRGHRLYYARILAASLLEMGAKVEIVTSKTALQSVEWQIHLGNLDKVPVRAIDANVTLTELGINSDLHEVSLTLVPDGDRYLVDAVRGRWRARGSVSILAMRPESQAGRGLRPRVWSIAKKLLILAADARPRVRAAALKSGLVKRKFPIRWVTDPVTLACSDSDVRAARADLDSDGRRYWVGVFGAVTPRKNLDLIAEAMLGIPNAGLLVAGSIDDATRALAARALFQLEEAGQAVRFRTSALRDAEFDALIASVDCVVAAHSNEGPSGVVGKAQAANRPLVLAGARSLRDDALSIGELAAWSELDSTAIARNIRHFAAKPSPSRSISPALGNFVDGLL